MITFRLFHLNWEHICPFFVHVYENSVSRNEVSKVIFDEAIIDSPQIWTIFIDMISQSWALLGPNYFSICNISVSVTWKDFNVLFVLYEEGRALAFFISMYIKANEIVEKISYDTKIRNKVSINERRRYYNNFFNYIKGGLRSPLLDHCDY